MSTSRWRTREDFVQFSKPDRDTVSVKSDTGVIHIFQRQRDFYVKDTN